MIESGEGGGEGWRTLACVSDLVPHLCSGAERTVVIVRRLSPGLPKVGDGLEKDRLLTWGLGRWASASEWEDAVGSTWGAH